MIMTFLSGYLGDYALGRVGMAWPYHNTIFHQSTRSILNQVGTLRIWEVTAPS